ncbi:MAG TPA: hypothetical protein VFB15_01825 [Candidatus Binataceae bacterium]|jgi:hypothetical protein|nr:hypothetical protein [Candidatus Binataceae bacterium]
MSRGYRARFCNGLVGLILLLFAPAFTKANASGSDNGAVVEIPSHGPAVPSPSKRHLPGARLANARIEILEVTRLGAAPPIYRVSGRIDGPGVTRAGVYLDGRMVQPIAVNPNSSSQFFRANLIVSGGALTVRAYGPGEVYIEQDVPLPTASND